MRRLAVVGDDLDPFDVPALTGLPEPAAFALLDVALDAGALVAAGNRLTGSGTTLVRQALVEQVPPHRRLDIHRDSRPQPSPPRAPPRAWSPGTGWDGGRRDEAEPWLLAAARRASSLGAFGDALGQLDPLLAHTAAHPAALRLRAEVLDALGDGRAPAAYAAARAGGRRLAGARPTGHAGAGRDQAG